MRLLIGQPDAMPSSSVPVWQNGTPQSMQRAPCLLQHRFISMLVKLIPVANPLRRRGAAATRADTP